MPPKRKPVKKQRKVNDSDDGMPDLVSESSDSSGSEDSSILNPILKSSTKQSNVPPIKPPNINPTKPLNVPPSAPARGAEPAKKASKTPEKTSVYSDNDSVPGLVDESDDDGSNKSAKPIRRPPGIAVKKDVSKVAPTTTDKKGKDNGFSIPSFDKINKSPTTKSSDIKAPQPSKRKDSKGFVSDTDMPDLESEAGSESEDSITDILTKEIKNKIPDLGKKASSSKTAPASASADQDDGPPDLVSEDDSSDSGQKKKKKPKQTTPIPPSITTTTKPTTISAPKPVAKPAPIAPPAHAKPAVAPVKPAPPKPLVDENIQPGLISDTDPAYIKEHELLRRNAKILSKKSIPTNQISTQFERVTLDLSSYSSSKVPVPKRKTTTLRTSLYTQYTRILYDVEDDPVDENDVF